MGSWANTFFLHSNCHFQLSGRYIVDACSIVNKEAVVNVGLLRWPGRGTNRSKFRKSRETAGRLVTLSLVMFVSYKNVSSPNPFYVTGSMLHVYSEVVPDQIFYQRQKHIGVFFICTRISTY